MFSDFLDISYFFHLNYTIFSAQGLCLLAAYMHLQVSWIYFLKEILMRKNIFFFDLLRVVAAFAVIVIHVLAPYRDQLGVLPDWQWVTAVTFNTFSRWAVPVFIMITGALMLTEQRSFELSYYIKKRVGKVFIPFIVWSVFYAFLSAISLATVNFDITFTLLKELPFHETYYHLGFFYYFIPLYFILPFFHWMVRNEKENEIKTLLMVWLCFTTFFLFYLDGMWANQYVLYGGYLLLGYVLYKNNHHNLMLLLPLSVLSLFVTDFNVVSDSFSSGEYTVGRWFSYKTINTVIVAAAVFVLCRYVSEKLNEKARLYVSFISRYSLGIYLLHPLFLWPLRHFDLYFSTPLIAIPIWSFIAGSFSLGASWLLSKSKKTAWLVP